MITKSSPPKVLLFDVMSTLVYDPIKAEIPDFFGLSLHELYQAKHPTAWVDFERGQISEETFYKIYLPDRPHPIDGPALRQQLFDAYRFLDGIEPLLQQLSARSVAMHALSNYPRWYQIIEAKLQLSRYLDWTFVSWKTGIRKPDPAAYTEAADTLGLPPERCLFIDDRPTNCDAAIQVGMDAIPFEDAPQLTDELRRRAVL